MYEKIVLIIYVCYLIIASIAAIALYKKDKKIAVSGSPNRIKEKTLLQISVFGGAIGAFIGRKIAHHKTDKKYFSFTIYLSMLLQIVVLACMIYFAVGGNV